MATAQTAALTLSTAVTVRFTCAILRAIQQLERLEGRTESGHEFTAALAVTAPLSWAYISRGKGGPAVAQKISVTFACDYDSKEIPEGEHMTRAFSLDGRDFEIDLCERHSQKFDEAVGRFTEKARKVSSRAGRPKRRTTAHRQRSADIRAWAKHNGMEVSDRGRIPANVIAKYEANH